MADRPRPLRRLVEAADVHAGLDLLARLTDAGVGVESIAVTPGALRVETLADVTPPEGLAVLHAMGDDPGGYVRVERSPGYADLGAAVSGRDVTIRVRRA